MKCAVVIPARYQSTRLPGKPLVPIAGVPMIVRTWRQCTKIVDEKSVYVATDDSRVTDVCEEHGIKSIMTSESCLTGTDRVAECAEKLDADVFINVQGDEPLFNPKDIEMLVKAANSRPDTIINGYAPLDSEVEHGSVDVPKVVIDTNQKLLYMSRAAIPGNKQGVFNVGWRQICAYAFPRRALAAFVEYGRKTPLEAEEDIEILRFLELGFAVEMIPMSADSIPVDNPADVKKVEDRLLNIGKQ